MVCPQACHILMLGMFSYNFMYLSHILKLIIKTNMMIIFQLWSLSSGKLLRSFTFDVAILSVIMDAAEYRLFAGGFNGKIYATNLFSQVCLRMFFNIHTMSSSVAMGGTFKNCPLACLLCPPPQVNYC